MQIIFKKNYDKFIHINYEYTKFIIQFLNERLDKNKLFYK